MRVISGTAKGHKLKSVPGQGTRPTSDRVKEAIFSAIGPYFSGGKVLDLFAGTGGLGIEALSRGCKQAVFVDKEAKSIAVVEQNLSLTKLKAQAKCLKMSAERAIAVLASKEERFDWIFLDPPYKLTGVDALMMTMQEKNLLNPKAMIVIEHDQHHHFPQRIGSADLYKRAEYGSTAITYYIYDREDAST